MKTLAARFAVFLCAFGMLGAASVHAAPGWSAGVRVRAAAGTAPGGSAGAHIPAAVYTDPPSDPRHPAAMTVLHVPSHGIEINGVEYSPPGPGAHPTLVICHGLPGNEKNLDLAQAVRRAGWNAVTFNYRGSWGSPGSFRFAQTLEDAAAVLAYLRDPANASKLGIDVRHLVLAGHSMGGWVATMTAAHDRGLAGVVLISMADMGRMGTMARKQAVAEMADNKEALAGVTAESMADELIAHAQEFSALKVAGPLAHTPILVLTADDGLAEHADALVQAIRAKGGSSVSTLHVATDHSWSDHRIALESKVIEWLGAISAQPTAL